MSENIGTDVQEQTTAPATVTADAQFQSLDDALKAYQATKQELEKLSRNLEQSRKEEKFSKTEAKRLKDELDKLAQNDQLAEIQGKYEAEVAARTALETKIRTRLVDSALESALKDAKAKSISTVMKLINRDDIQVNGDEVDTASIQAVVDRLRAEDSVLFDEVETPSVKRAAEGAVVGGFEKEIRAAKTQKEIEDIMRRYGKM